MQSNHLYVFISIASIRKGTSSKRFVRMRRLYVEVYVCFQAASPMEVDVHNTFKSMLATLDNLYGISKRVAAPAAMRVQVQHAALAACSFAESLFHL
jgi:hypothetical protein